MRAVFLLVVLANLAFFAWANFFSEVDTQSDPRPVARQIAPEKLRVLPAAPPIKPAPEAPAPKPPPDPLTPQAALAITPCLELAGLSAADAARANDALVPLASKARLSQKQVDESAGWWVFIPPRGSKQDAQKKAAELKARGVEEYFILQDEGPQRYALSLGVFKTEAAALSRLEALRTKGVKTAQVGPRQAPLQRVYFQVRDADAPLAAKLRELAQSFTGTELRECPPAAQSSPQ